MSGDALEVCTKRILQLEQRLKESETKYNKAIAVIKILSTQPEEVVHPFVSGALRTFVAVVDVAVPNSSTATDSLVH